MSSVVADRDPVRPGIHMSLLENQENPFPIYEKLREHYPVCQLEPDGHWAVSRYDDVRFALRRPDLFSSSGFKATLQPDWLSAEYRGRDLFILMQDPVDHMKYRPLVSKAFVGQAIDALIPLMRETAQSLVEKIRPNEEIDFLEDFAYPYVHKIIGKITGVEEGQSLEEVRQWMGLIGKVTRTRPDDQYIRALEAALLAQKVHFDAIIRDRRERPRQDLISALVHSKVDGEYLTDHMLRNALDLLLVAGYHTSLQILCHSMIWLSRRPEIRWALAADPHLIPAFVEELLRLESIASAILRQTTDKITLSGVIIPKGATVFLLLAAANRDPSQFPDPGEFKMGRKNIKRHMAFGHGPHTCVGAALARLEVRIALETILAAFDNFSCPADHELCWSKSIMNRSVSELPTVFGDCRADKSLSVH